MIFVNDFFTLSGVPKWLLHTEMNEDGMGFSDVIFPVFLVIVGMSIPFAITTRRAKGDDNFAIFMHIGERTLALLVMGFLLVNYEHLKANEAVIPKPWIGMGIITCFFLIWNAYPKGFKASVILKIVGISGLCIYAFTYPGGLLALKPHWWGILGLIGWSYLWAALAYLWTGNQPKRILIVLVFFLLYCVSTWAGLFNILKPLKEYVWIVESGALPFLVMLGVLSSVLYQNNTFKNYPLALVYIGLALVILGFALRPFWGISKILASPAWICICGGIAFIVYALLYWVVDVKHRLTWSNFLKPAGVATLTCYLVPYYWYGVRSLSGLRIPDALNAYPLGLLMSFAVSVIIIQITGVLIQLSIKLKV